ncbi:hypothetical protein HW555_007823, partial [Spodoptera exigua]
SPSSLWPGDFIPPVDVHIGIGGAYFRQFFDDNLLDFIVDVTNLYLMQNTGKSINIFLEIEMGIVKMPAVEDYWCKDLRFENIASPMIVKRYRCIKRYLHFCDNTNVDTTNRYHIISVVLEYIRQQCLKLEEERSFAIDEMIIPYKNKKAGSRKQYNPKNPTNGVSKFWFGDFFAYDGSHTFKNDKFTD